MKKYRIFIIHGLAFTITSASLSMADISSNLYTLYLFWNFANELGGPQKVSEEDSVLNKEAQALDYDQPYLHGNDVFKEDFDENQAYLKQQLEKAQREALFDYSIADCKST